MGLDQYLYRKNYLHYNERDTIKEALGRKPEYAKESLPEGFKLPKVLRPIFEHLENCCGFEEEVAYWRKANMLHGWFVRNCQSIREDIEIKVTYQDLVNLLKDINEVLENTVLETGQVHMGTTFTDKGIEEKYEEGLIVKDSSVAEELLPTTQGFFFGSYDYDEYYVMDLKDAKEKLEKVINESNEDDEFLYYASY